MVKTGQAASKSDSKKAEIKNEDESEDEFLPAFKVLNDLDLIDD